MPVQVGTYDINSLLAVRYQSINEFGYNTVVEVLQADNANHNAIVTDMVQSMCKLTTDTQGVYGSGSSGAMAKVDEYGKSESQKLATGSTVAWPLELYQYPVGWTKKFLQNATPADLAQMQQGAQKAHKQAIQVAIKRAIFTSTNSTFNDFLINNVALGVKAFVNADSASIPDAPDGSTFNAASHTHYDAAASLTAGLVDAAIADLIEHGHGANVMIAVHHSNAAAFQALTGFTTAVRAGVIPATNVTIAEQRSNVSNQYNRFLGYYGAAEVWVKPWAVAGYFFTWDAGSPMKPLAFRQRAGGDVLTGLQIAAEFDSHPLQTEFYEVEFGVGVNTRTNGVVTQFTNGTYQIPTFTL